VGQLTTLFRFDVLAQLANIPTRITLYELLRLSKSMKEALRETLADSEAFMAQIPAVRKEEDGNTIIVSRSSSHALHSHQMIYKYKGNMTDPYITQGTSDHLK